jgi:hypothetical protein
MSTQTYQVGESLLFSYVIAGAEMRYVPVNEREIYLRNDATRDLIVRGEVPGCGSNCYADLNQIFLEFALSCRGCKDGLIAAELAEGFGQRLGQLLVTKLYHEAPEASTIDQVAFIFKFILDSMNATFETTREPDLLHYDLDYCPIHQAAEEGGLNLGVAMAHRVFVALCESLLQSLAADWVLQKPSERETDDPILEITLARSTI